MRDPMVLAQTGPLAMWARRSPGSTDMREELYRGLQELRPMTSFDSFIWESGISTSDYV